MSLLEPHLSDVRAGFGNYGYPPSLALGSSPYMPVWRPTPTSPLSWCTIPSCPCNLSRPYTVSDLYDYSALSYSWPSWYLKAAQDPLYKGLPPLPPPPAYERRESIDNRDSPGKELPTKSQKEDRRKERRELSHPLGFGKDHALKHRQVCAGTQTQMTTVTPDHYTNGDTNTSESYSHHHHALLHQSAPSHPNLQPPSPRFAHLDLHSHHDGPLNLSLTNSSTSNRSSPTQARPSVITCATSVPTSERYDSGSSNSTPSPNRREVTSVEVCDPAIEEHFRRSLGTKYPEYMAKHSSATPSPPLVPPHQVLPPPPSSLTSLLPLPPPAPVSLPPPPPLPMATVQSLPPPPQLPPPPLLAQRQALPSPPSLPPPPPLTTTATSRISPPSLVSVVGSVDDHFARALGNSTWSALKAKKEAAKDEPLSVDDHFAKALGGDTWHRIKAEKETNNRANHPFPISHALTHPHPLPPPITHPHASHPLPHPRPQRPSSPATKPHGTSLLST